MTNSNSKCTDIVESYYTTFTLNINQNMLIVTNKIIKIILIFKES